MTTFDTREKAFENKFVHDANIRFLANARRDKRLGAWAANMLGLTGHAAADYARALRLRIDVVAKLKSDFAAWSIPVTEAEIHAKMSEFETQALREVAAGL